jgi:replicative DNA helicase
VDKTLEYMAKSARPDLHNLREGGEQEADVVLGLMNYAADMKTDEGDGNATDRFDVGVLKNRYGPTAKWARLVFEAERGRIREKGGF